MEGEEGVESPVEEIRRKNERIKELEEEIKKKDA